MTLQVSAHAHGHLLHQFAGTRTRAGLLRPARRMAPTAARLRAQAADLIDDLETIEDLAGDESIPVETGR